jgi:hypothetical protein
MKKLIFFAAFAASFLFGCEKEEQSAPACYNGALQPKVILPTTLEGLKATTEWSIDGGQP